MPGLFISHAHADKAVVDQFIDTILRLGCNAGREDIFYSSGGDTGAPAGTDLNAHVRREVGEAGLVIAILTPSFRASPFCIAELGAAWSHAGRLIPLIASGMERNDLDGVLTGMVVRHIDDPHALDELHDRVCDELALRTNATTWGAYKTRWLTFIEGQRTATPAVPKIGATSVAACSRDRDHMEVFWTDGSGSISYRWWEEDRNWSDVLIWADPPATHVAAASRAPDDQWLFGVYGVGQLWAARWGYNEERGHRAGVPEWLPGEVAGPLTAVTRDAWHLELMAWTPDGQPCRAWRIDGRWTEWTTDW